MDHFPPENWVDLARGLLPPAAAAPMKVHLEQRCAECVKASETWRLIVEFCSREVHYEPDPAILRIVKAAYTPATPWNWARNAAHSSKLVFDSWRHPSPAMVRGSQPVTRQLVHEADPFVIDLRLESDPARRRIFLMGQILNSENPENVTADVDIVLLSGEKLIGTARVNTSGEFDMEMGPDPNLHLFINIRGQRAIGIPLPDLER